jgi:phosphoribosyl-dephospho-CoA transferase
MSAPAARLAAGAGDIPVHVYGSAFWQQHASGRSYLREDSDLDLLARPDSAAAAQAWLRLLAEVQLGTGVRLDGEVELPDGAAVAWPELAAATPRLLVKTDAGPALRERASVWSAWERTPC